MQQKDFTIALKKQMWLFLYVCVF